MNYIILHLKRYIELFYIDLKLKQNRFTILSKILIKITRMVSFGFSVMKNIVVFPARSKFPVKLNCCITFGLASSAFCLFKFIAIKL